MNGRCQKLILSINFVILIGNFILLGGCTSNLPIDSKKSFSSTQIALLVPLESQNKSTNKFALQLVNAARLALQDLDHLNLALSVYPTSGKIDRASHAAKAAVNRGAEIIIGPVFSEETSAVKEVLRDTQIKIISLSNDPTVAGDNVFILGTTFQSSADRLISFALSQGFKRIAIIGPEGDIGVNGITAVKNSINDNGAILTTTSLYPLSPKGIQSSALNIYDNLIKSESEAVIFTDVPTRGLAFITEQMYQL